MGLVHLRYALATFGWIFVVPCTAVVICTAVAVTFGVVLFIPTFVVLLAALVKALNRPT